MNQAPALTPREQALFLSPQELSQLTTDQLRAAARAVGFSGIGNRNDLVARVTRYQEAAVREHEAQRRQDQLKEESCAS